jgi:hypothetical protein
MVFHQSITVIASQNNGVFNKAADDGYLGVVLVVVVAVAVGLLLSCPVSSK